jgi:hypothetical protein
MLIFRLEEADLGNFWLPGPPEAFQHCFGLLSAACEHLERLAFLRLSARWRLALDRLPESRATRLWCDEKLTCLERNFLVCGIQASESVKPGMIRNFFFVFVLQELDLLNFSLPGPPEAF